VRVPIRVNRSRARLLPARLSSPDPGFLLQPDPSAPVEAFSSVVSLFLLNGTYKSTSPGRHRDSDRLLLDRLAGSTPVVLDVGASDGSTSLDLIRALGDSFAKYYVTDRAVSVHVAAADGRAYFYDAGGACVLVRTPSWVLYPTASGAGWDPLLRALHGGVPPFVPGLPEISLVQPALLERARRDSRVEIRAHDVFDPWRGATPDVVKVANLLNPAYFADDRIRAAIRTLGSALAVGGLLLVIDNRDVEQASLFERTAAGFRLVARVRGGTDVEALVLAQDGATDC
jgi:hypothetical protein